MYIDHAVCSHSCGRRVVDEASQASKKGVSIQTLKHHNYDMSYNHTLNEIISADSANIIQFYDVVLNVIISFPNLLTSSVILQVC